LLPPDIQAIVEKVNEEWAEKTGQLWDQMDKEGKTYALGKGIQFIALSKDEDARWAAKMKPIIDEYVRNMTTKNLHGEEALKFCLDYLKKY